MLTSFETSQIGIGQSASSPVRARSVHRKPRFLLKLCPQRTFKQLEKLEKLKRSMKKKIIYLLCFNNIT
jgi:hypothetical protein